MYNVFLPVLQFSPVSIIPPLLHTHPSIYHPHCIMFSPSTSVFPCQYHSTIAPNSSLSTCCFSQKDKWQEPSKNSALCAIRQLWAGNCAQFFQLSKGGISAQSISRPHLTKEALISCHSRLSGICGGQTDSGTSFVPLSRFSPVIFTPPKPHQHLNPHTNLVTIRDTDGRKLQISKDATISGGNIRWKGVWLSSWCFWRVYIQTAVPACTAAVPRLFGRWQFAAEGWNPVTCKTTVFFAGYRWRL